MVLLEKRSEELENAFWDDGSSASAGLHLP